MTNTIVENIKAQISQKIVDGNYVDSFLDLTDELDKLISDKELMEFLNNAGIKECERCGKLENKDFMRSHGDYDSADLLCEDCHGEQY